LKTIYIQDGQGSGMLPGGKLKRRVRDQSLKANRRIWGAFNSMIAVLEDHSSQTNVFCLEDGYCHQWRFKPSNFSLTQSLVLQTIRKMTAISLGKYLNIETKISSKICI